MHVLISSADDLLWQVVELATKDWASIADLMLLQPRISFHGSDFFKPGKQISPVAFSAYQCCMLKHLCMAEQLLLTCDCAFLKYSSPVLLTCLAMLVSTAQHSQVPALLQRHCPRPRMEMHTSSARSCMCVPESSSKHCSSPQTFGQPTYHVWGHVQLRLGMLRRLNIELADMMAVQGSWHVVNPHSIHTGTNAVSCQHKQ